MSDGPVETGCPYWKDERPSAAVCNACPLTGYFCGDCPDKAICPKAGMRRIPEEISRWIAAYGDKKSLDAPLPGTEYNRDMQAYRIIARTIADYEAEQIKKMKQSIK